MKQFLLTSFNGKWQLPIVVKSDKKHWASRRCWYVHCSNEIMVVHISEHGNATHGYCWWCYRQSIMNDIFYGGQGYTRGKWVTVDKNYKTKKIFLKEDKSSKQLLKSFLSRFVPRKTNTQESQS